MSGSTELSLTFRGQVFTDPQMGMHAVGNALTSGVTQSASKLSTELKTFLTNLSVQLAAKHGGGWPGGTTASTLSRRSGTLVQALLDGVKVSGTSVGSLQGSMSGPGYMMVQEFGATISAGGSRYLAIPLPAALTSNGLPLKQSPRDWGKTFIAMSRAGNLLIFQKQGAEIVPLYLLKNAVTIRPRLGARQALKDGLPYFAQRAVDVVSASIRGQ
jgi:hypothetical protein